MADDRVNGESEQPSLCSHPISASAFTPRWSLGTWVWFIAKNIVGWVLILLAFLVGPFVPGPGGIPIFLVGFALVTFPGKRRLTARVLRGIPVSRSSKAYTRAVAAIAIIAPGIFVPWLFHERWPFFEPGTPRGKLAVLTYLCGVTLVWVFGLRGVHIINGLLAVVPRIRRKVRPWLRRRGLDLLPPRRRARLCHRDAQFDDEEILEIDQRHRHRFNGILRAVAPWAIRLFRVVLVTAIFWWMLKPVYRRWDEVGPRIMGMNWWLFALAAAMFAVFLFVFRALAWRRIIRGFGYDLPIAPATRIWSFSELARYIPGVVWQVLGRVQLSKPYGVSATASSASQILELALFMLANIIVAVVCLTLAGLRLIPPEDRHWLLIAVLLIPLLLTLLHPKVFYTVLNRVMARLGKPSVSQALKKRQLAAVAAWNILGLLWQSLAIWILTYSVLGLPIQKWYVLAGAYCLAWTMGFSIGFLSPGGIGVRELVFATTLYFILPASFVGRFDDPAKLAALSNFLGVLLRLWAIAGELTMASVAYLADYRGARGDLDAPGKPARLMDAAVETPS